MLGSSLRMMKKREYPPGGMNTLLKQGISEPVLYVNAKPSFLIN